MPANGLVLSAMVEDNSESLILSWVFWTRVPMSIGNSRAGPLLRCFSRYGFFILGRNRISNREILLYNTA